GGRRRAAYRSGRETARRSGACGSSRADESTLRNIDCRDVRLGRHPGSGTKIAGTLELLRARDRRGRTRLRRPRRARRGCETGQPYRMRSRGQAFHLARERCARLPERFSIVWRPRRRARVSAECAVVLALAVRWRVTQSFRAANELLRFLLGDTHPAFASRLAADSPSPFTESILSPRVAYAKHRRGTGFFGYPASSSRSTIMLHNSGRRPS